MDAGKSSSNNSYWLCPLYSFGCDCECLDLAEGIQIKPAPRGLAEYIQKRTYYLYGQWDDPSDVHWVALLPYRAKAIEEAGIENIKIGLEEQDRAIDLLVDLITALRLCHEGEITVGPLIYAATCNSQWSIGGNEIWTRVSERDFLHREPKYILHQSDVPQVNELVSNFDELRKLEEPDNLGIALRRFNSSYHGSLEDRLIDQMIAFEFLYLGYDQELKYRLALRVAFLLGKDDGERKDIFNKMRKAYNLRSDTVHGNKQLGWPELKEVVSETEEYLRQSIRKFLLLLSSKEHSLENLRQGKGEEPAELDKNILSNSTLLASDKPSKE